MRGFLLQEKLLFGRNFFLVLEPIIYREQSKISFQFVQIKDNIAAALYYTPWQASR